MQYTLYWQIFGGKFSTISESKIVTVVLALILFSSDSMLDFEILFLK